MKKRNKLSIMVLKIGNTIIDKCEKWGKELI